MDFIYKIYIDFEQVCKIGWFNLTNKLVPVLVLIIILVGLSSFAFEIPSVEAQETIIIRINGNIEPPDAPLTQTDTYTYTFTDDAETGMGLYVELDGVLIDGAGYFDSFKRWFYPQAGGYSSGRSYSERYFFRKGGNSI